MPVVSSKTQPKNGSKAPDFNLVGTDDEFHVLSELKGERAYLIVFMCNHCPYVKAKLAELNRIHKDFKNKGLIVIGISSNDAREYPEDSFEEMKKTTQSGAVQFAYLYDEEQIVAREYGAQCTPDPFLFDKDFKLLFHSRIDDAPSPSGKPKRHELYDAIKEYLDKGKITQGEHAPIGCSIKWKNQD